MAAAGRGVDGHPLLAAAAEFSKALASGGLASAIAKTVVAPFERVKLLLQTQTLVPGHQPYKSALDAFIRIPREQGVLSFWRGNTMNVSRIVPSYALRFSLLLCPKTAAHFLIVNSSIYALQFWPRPCLGIPKTLVIVSVCIACP